MSTRAAPPLVRLHGAPLVWLLLLAAPIFWWSRHNHFFLDDYARILHNPGIRQLSPMSRHFLDTRSMASEVSLIAYRPLLPLTLSWNFAAHGLRTEGYHLFNQAIHALSSILLYLICLRLMQAAGTPGGPREHRGIALVTATLFAIHPVSTFTTTYICARDLLLTVCFMVATLLSYMAGRQEPWSSLRHLRTGGLLMLGLASKENAAMLPALALLLEFTVYRSPARSKGPWLRVAPLVGVVITFFLARHFLIPSQNSLSALLERRVSETVPLQLVAHLHHYMRNFVRPDGIRFMPRLVHPGSSSPAFWLAVAFPLLTLGLAWRWRRRYPLGTFCLLGYWVTLIPTSSVFPLLLVCTHYRPYPASPFFYLLVALGAARLVRSPVGRGAGLALLTGLLLVASHRQVSIARTTETHWRHSLAYGGDYPAYTYFARQATSLPSRRLWLEHALQLYPHSADALTALGQLELMAGNLEAAEAVLSSCVRGARGGPQVNLLIPLSLAIHGLGRPAEAERLRRQAAEADPASELGLLQLYTFGVDCNRFARYDLAVPVLREVLARAPAYQEARYLLGYALARAGDHESAVAQLQATIRAPRERRAYLFTNLGFSLRHLGRQDEAADALRRALALDPGDEVARFYLEERTRGPRGPAGRWNGPGPCTA